MTKQELMNYSWSRGFNYEDLLHIATMMTDVVVPTKEEYLEYSEQAFEDMLRYMDREYEDAQAEKERIRTELGWGLLNEVECER